MSAEGWALRRTLYDARGNAVDISTFAADGALHVASKGVARQVVRFGERNLVEDVAFFGADGKPVTPPSHDYGYEFSADSADLRFAPGLAARAAMDAFGRLDPALIQAIVRQALPTFKQCYDAGAKKLRGQVRVRFVILESGTVNQVTDRDSTLADKAIVSCVLDATSKLTFPRRSAGGTVTVVYPIQFAP